MPRFRVDCGNSTVGPVVVAVVNAADKRAALDLVRNELPDTIELRLEHEAIEYLNVYLNGDGISITDVEEDE